MAFSTYNEYKDKEASEKTTLVILEPSKRLIGWVLDSGVVYKLEDFTEPVLVGLKDSGTTYTEVASKGAITASSFFHDRDNQTLFLQASDSSNPNSRFLVLVFQLFFSTRPNSLPFDLGSGFDVEWLPILKETSQFGQNLDNTNQLGVAIEGSGRVEFVNDRDFWKSRYDKFTFENGSCFVYSYSPSLPVAEAKLIFKGKIQEKNWSNNVSFLVKDLFNELRGRLELNDISEIGAAKIPDQLRDAKQRQLYGFLSGYRPTNIDQVTEDGYLLTGTISLTAGSDTVTGAGTQFLIDLNADDEIFIEDEADAVTIGSVASNTSLTLSEEFTKNLSGKTFTVIPKLPKRYTNRSWVLSGHSLREPSTTVDSPISSNKFTIVDISDFENADLILVGSEIVQIRRVSNNGLIRLETNLATPPLNGTVVKRLTVTNVFINETELTFSRDFTYDPTLGRFLLDDLAEFNVASIRNIIGTVSFTNTSRAVTGTGTRFSTQLNENSFIRAENQADFFEILSIESDTSLTLRTASTYTESAVEARFKRPDVFNNSGDVLSCDVLGGTEDDTPSGVFIRTAPQIVEDLIKKAGLSAFIDSTSFDDAALSARQKVGLAIPERFSTKTPPKIRKIIDQANRSVFGSLKQNQDFLFEYKTLEPIKSVLTSLQLDKSDILDFSVKSKSDRIVKTVVLFYLNKEFDRSTKRAGKSKIEISNEEGEFLVKSNKDFEINTILFTSQDAENFARRWGGIFSTSHSIIQFETKLQAALLEITDLVDISHPFLFEKIGSNLTRKLAAVQFSKKSGLAVSSEIEDLANSFSKVAAITENDAVSFNQASEQDLIYNGYITDTFGMISNGSNTFGINLIW